MRKRLVYVLIAMTLSCAVFFTACQRQQGPGGAGVFTVRLAHIASEAETFHIAALRFKELIEERSNGRFIVNIFPAGQLGNPREIIESLQMGVIDLGILSTATVVNFIPAFAALDLPWVFTGWDHGIAVTQQPFIRELYAQGYDRGLVPMALMPQGFRNVSNRVRPIYTPQDLVGLRLRVVESPVFVATFEAVGANVTAMAWGEVFTAMQQGAIDAAEMPFSQFYNERMFEIQNYYSLTEHMFAFGSFIASRTLYDRLPADLRQLVRDAAHDAMYITGMEVRAGGPYFIRDIEARGVRVNEMADGTKAQFRQMVQGFYENFLATADPQVRRFVSYIEGM